MPENPLLPNAQLQALHALLLEAVHPTKKGPGKKKKSATLPSELGSQEALLAGSILQLEQGDILVGRAGTSAASRLSQAKKKPSLGSASTLDLPSGAPQLALAAGLAAALRNTGSDRVVLAMLSAADEYPDWANTLTSAQEGKYPLLIACADPSGTETFRPGAATDRNAKTLPWSWSSVQRLAGRLQLPILTVDGEDAVAVYRVTQESILRARAGGGPVILWAMLPTTADLAAVRPKGASPLRRLERYLRARSIPF